MPPNTSSGSGSILNQYECSYKKVANPYSETKNACFEECPGSSGHRNTREHEVSEQLAEDTTRVTTRARLTYELYKYSKNAMLIVAPVPACNFKRPNEVIDLKTTFENFRFEVDVVTIGVDTVELYDICGQFFRRDFTDYGAVALVILTPMGVNRPLYPAFKTRYFEDSVIMDYLKLERNPTLVDKPKIYITEASRGCGFVESETVYDHFNGLNYETHGDVLGFHCDAIDTMNFRRISEDINPATVFNGYVEIFCQKLAAMGDNVTLTDIIAQTITDTKANYSRIPLPMQFISETSVGVVNTLRKQLYFARVEEN